MILNKLNPRKSLNKAYLKVKPHRSDIEVFKSNLIQLIDQTNDTESEEFHKNLVSDFLKKTYYGSNHSINTKGRNDLVIHNGKDAISTVGVIIEAKKPTNKMKMLRTEKLNTKAFQELVLYYLRERITQKNLEIKYLIATNINEWFVFDANIFENNFAQDKKLVKQFEDFEAGRLAGTKTDFFYKEIAAPFVEKLDRTIEFTYFDLHDYDKPLRNDHPKDDNKLIALFKLFSPEHLLKLPFANDSNSLDKKFYSELLHIIGLTEAKDKRKKVIQQNKVGERNTGSLLENAIIQLDTLDKIHRLEKPSQYGETMEDRVFNVGLELSITWINRILFLKLLEAQLIAYHKGGESYSFLNFKKINSYDDLNSLFFQVLAKKHNERNEDVKVEFSKVPYLNSSLFEPNELEHSTILISNLRDEKKLPILSSTVLKDENGKKRTGELNALEYFFAFLEAYDFSSEGAEDIQEDNKTLINASVLGLIFEKINGYKDGSFFTPGFITMYICRETIRRSVVQKFNDTKGWKCKDLDDLYDKIEDRQEANDIVNSLKICDPAVGSGHFLVSALNEMIAIKNDLKILQDRDGKRLKEYYFEVVNDELVVTDDDGELFEYVHTNKEAQRVQETLFHEKQTIIENCLFGVDINPNSIKICRLRLWIELLKNAYYKNKTELETLPNIDINIKCGNSLISRFDLDADIKKALKKSKWNVETYRTAVDNYRNTQSKEEKHEMLRLINDIKSDFKLEISKNNPIQKKLNKLGKALFELTGRGRYGTGLMLFEPEEYYGKDRKRKKERKAKIAKIEKDIKKYTHELEEIKNNKIYKNAFEWRFEFPKVLNDEGDFVGFDTVIGNPPYFSLSKIKEQQKFFETAGYVTYTKGADVYCLFYEKGGQILRNNGFLTYITSNSWLRTIYGNKLKSYFINNTPPVSLVNIEDIQIFEEATVESNIITTQKGKDAESFPIANLSTDYILGDDLQAYFDSHSFIFEIPETPEWFIGQQEIGLLKLKIEKGSKLLKKYDVKINFGIKTGFNEAFIISEDLKNKLVQKDPQSKEVIKPILRGRDLKKFSHEFSGLWVIISKFKFHETFSIKYKSATAHLTKYKSKLEKRGQVTNGQHHWLELDNNPTDTYLDLFKRDKIVWGEISDKPKFAFDEGEYHAEATTFFMTGEKLKFLLAILNSKVSEWYFNLIGTTTGMGTNRWKKYKIELLPIKEPTPQQEQEIESKVTQIISLKKADPEADTSALEAEIDRLVYEFYGLTAQEIEIIENSVK